MSKYVLYLLGALLLFGAGTGVAFDDNVRDDDVGIWETLEWTDLNPAEQGLWKTLGWSEASWNDEADPPASEAKGWADLSASEQEAARSLGYEQGTWDE